MGDSSPYTRSTKKCINQNPDSFNQYFTEFASKLTKLAAIIPEQESDGTFVIKHTTFTEVNKSISELGNDCSQVVMAIYQ